MTKCQVSGCQKIASYRCEAGFYYCYKHQAHTHSDFNVARRALLKPVFETGEYLYTKKAFK